MENQFVTFEIAKQLKELGFNEKCLAHYSFYDNQPKFHWNDISSYNRSRSMMKNLDSLKEKDFNYESTPITAPLWQQAIDWLREKHKINIFFDCEMNASSMEIDWFKYKYKIYVDRVWSNRWFYNGFKTYEEARNQAILKAIELITQNKTE